MTAIKIEVPGLIERLDKIITLLEGAGTPYGVPAEPVVAVLGTPGDAHAVEEDKPAPAPVEEEKPVAAAVEPQAPEYTKADVQALVQKLAAPTSPEHKRAGAKAIVKSYGSKVSDIPADKYAEVMERLTALDKEGKA